MAFVRKVWKNRISEFFNRYRLENVKTGEAFNAYINLNDGAVEEPGDRLNAEALNDLEQRIENAFEDVGGGEDMIAGVEATSTASQAYTIGQYLIYNKLLYKVTSAIALGDTLTVGTNIAQKKIAEEVSDHLVVNGTEFYFDSHDGKFGYNTSPNRGADTFFPFNANNLEYIGPFEYSFMIVKTGSGWGVATGSQIIRTTVYDPQWRPAVFPTPTTGYGDNVGVALSYNSDTGIITVTGTSYYPGNDSTSYQCKGEVYLFKKTFFDFSFSISKTASGWAMASGSQVISTEIKDATKHPILYLISANGNGDSAYITASYDPTTGNITVSGNTMVVGNGSWSTLVTGVVFLI